MTDSQLKQLIESVKPQPPTTNERFKEWLRIVSYGCSIAGLIVFIAVQAMQLRFHDAETRFYERLSGAKQTATITENAMNDYYNKNLEYIEHCKQVQTCNLPPNLAVIQPLPKYVPMATFYIDGQPPKQTKETQ